MTGKKNEAKLFMLRNVNFHGMNSPKDLYAVIIEQLGSKTVADSTDFEVGYYVGNKRVWIRNQNDIHDIIHLLKTKDNHSVTLWCMDHSATPTVRSKRPRNPTVLVSDDSDDETPEKQQTAKSKPRKIKSRQEEKLERIDDLIDQLKEKHDTKYNVMQYRIWAETIDAGRHSSLEMPPRGSIFN